ncbi:MAG: metal-dependent hydrolase, partial [Gammaproteobacteria bacterium AqS3]|nr:metal-dependent hydrolase [Gammaproteobacteria bacterium AqS3]
MDSVTQLTFGAAIGYAVAGREHGWKAAAAGAICGTLPDLDILVSYDDPITEYVEHRGFTHSLFWLTLATPPIALFLSRIFRIGVTLSWALGMWLALVTHPVLDAFTIYGTKLWLPFSSEPVLWSTLFIIDPLYTVPLIIAVVMALRRSRAGFHSRAPLWALWISSAYLAWSVAAKAIVSERIEATLAQKGIPYTQYVSTPVVYGTFFWRALAMTPDGYYEGYIWLLEDGVQWNKRSSRTDLIPALEQSETFRKLQWFSR